MIEITSRENQHIKMARMVRDGRDPGFVHVEGVRLAEEVINSGWAISSIFVDSDAIGHDRIKSLIAKTEFGNADVYQISATLLGLIADTQSPQGIVAIAARPNSGKAEIDQRMSSPREYTPMVLMLEEANNPSNIGAIIRSAEAAGIAGLITTTGSADAFSAKSIRASMGSCFRLPIWERVTIDRILGWAELTGLSVCGLAGNATKSIYDVDWKTPTLLVAGSEAHGITAELREKLNRSVQIPMANSVESLNLAAACAITMFEARRQSIVLRN